MSLPRLIKTSVSLLSGQGVLILNQLLLPPLFLRSYGVVGYGEWLTLSSAAQYLGTLNFGLHNYANNHVTIAYNRGDLAEVNVVQATAFAIVLGMVSLVAVLAAIAFVLPWSSWLHLSTVSSMGAAATVYFFGLSILIRMIFGFLQTAFLVIGAYHRGSNWNNAQFVTTVLVTAALAIGHTTFVWLALGQMLVISAFALLVGIDLYLKAPVAFPKLQHASRSRVMDILRPSGYFGLLFSATFLVYQLPVIILQRMLGPLQVVVFSVTRTVFSMSRQALTSISTALGPEITESFGQDNWAGLLKLYDLSERVVFSLVPVITLGTFVAAPALMAMWLHKPQLFQPDICIYMALISAAAGVKEHKYQFQISINHHKWMARFIFFTYVVMVALMAPCVSRFGVRGFLALWLITETAQALYIMRLNQELFQSHASLSVAPLWRLAAILGLGMAACWFVAGELQGKPWLIQLTAAALISMALLVIEYPIFGLRDVRLRLLSGWLRRGSEEELRSAA